MIPSRKIGWEDREHYYYAYNFWCINLHVFVSSHSLHKVIDQKLKIYINVGKVWIVDSPQPKFKFVPLTYSPPAITIFLHFITGDNTYKVDFSIIEIKMEILWFW